VHPAQVESSVGVDDEVAETGRTREPFRECLVEQAAGRQEPEGLRVGGRTAEPETDADRHREVDRHLHAMPKVQHDGVGGRAPGPQAVRVLGEVAGAGCSTESKVAMPSLALVVADGGYAGKLVDWARRIPRIVLEIARKPDGPRGFAVLPRRWVVERTLSWLTAHRRRARDYQRLPEHSEARVKWAMIGLMTRWLAPTPGRKPWT